VGPALVQTPLSLTPAVLAERGPPVVEVGAGAPGSLAPHLTGTLAVMPLRRPPVLAALQPGMELAELVARCSPASVLGSGAVVVVPRTGRRELGHADG